MSVDEALWRRFWNSSLAPILGLLLVIAALACGPLLWPDPDPGWVERTVAPDGTVLDCWRHNVELFHDPQCWLVLGEDTE